MKDDKFKYTVYYSASFKKDFKLIQKRHFKITKFEKVVSMLANGISLPEQYRDHQLSGKFENYRECHIEPDWLLIYYKKDDLLILTLTRTGTHSDIF